ncbi:hypothetical protein Bpfe_026991 [Biomphalaria pfeifferi]|uniref:Uncharacterized protein n=1 Tax=Biomphalaria pfeifferi TaxID=112525 RepID=A0AAD8EXM2_BIOPF|nr:hypothetical protein Bpfe_026991 [Biomphalaria pfeifferi]
MLVQTDAVTPITKQSSLVQDVGDTRLKGTELRLGQQKTAMLVSVTSDQVPVVRTVAVKNNITDDNELTV